MPAKKYFGEDIHGTASGYVYKKCRCDKCRKWRHDQPYLYQERDPEWRRQMNQTRREAGHALVDKIKDAPCTDCGVKYPPYVMDFDHIGDDKTNSVSYFIQFRAERILEEIAKCELVCANCHRERTERRRRERSTT